MPLDDHLDRGETVDIHITLGARNLAVIDGLCERYGASRGRVVEALLAEHAESAGRHLPSGMPKRRPGAGRPRDPR